MTLCLCSDIFCVENFVIFRTYLIEGGCFNMVATRYIIGCTWFLHNIETNEFLMMLRDDKQDIPYPNKWVFPGGTVEGNETAEEASYRELLEKLDYHIPTHSLQKIFTLHYPSKTTKEHFFYIPLIKQIDELTFNEGQKFELFTLEQIKKMDLGFWCKEIVPILERWISPLW